MKTNFFKGWSYTVFYLLLLSIQNLSAANITLEEAVRTAYVNNPYLQSMRINFEAVGHKKAISRAQFLPRVDFEQKLISTDQQVAAFGINLNQGNINESDFNPDILNNPETVTDYVTTISLHQPIYNGGRELLGLRIAESQYTEADWQIKQAEENIISETVTAYLDSLRSNESYQITLDALKTAKKNQEMIQNQYDQGLVIKSDLLQANVHVSELEEKLVISENNRELNRVRLNVLLGNPDGNYEPLGSLDGFGCPEVTLNELKTWALKDNPNLQIYTEQEKMSSLRLRMAQSSFYPDINMYGNYEYHGADLFNNGSDAMTLSLSFKFNLFKGTADYNDVKLAKSQMEAIKKMREFERNRILLSVEKAYSNLHSAKQRLNSTEFAVTQALESLRIIEQRYQAGATGIVDLLRAELALSNAKFNRLNANYDLLLGHTSICHAVGHLTTRWLNPDQCPVPDLVSEKQLHQMLEKGRTE
ncbi:TolC family protein [bacterium]|nr:TolC family protein [candidate division CSSED10-310 bacterium]